MVHKGIGKVIDIFTKYSQRTGKNYYDGPIHFSIIENLANYEGGKLQDLEGTDKDVHIGKAFSSALQDYKKVEGIIYEAFGKIRANIVTIRKNNADKEELIFDDFICIRRTVIEGEPKIQYKCVLR